MEKRLAILESMVANIRDNHLHALDIKVTRLAENQEWLLKFFWIAAGGLIVGVIGLYFR